MVHKKIKSLFLSIILFIFGTGMAAGLGPGRPAVWPTAGWTSSTPEAQGVDSRKLAEAFDFLKAKEPHIHSLLIVRNGVLVADAYFYPFSAGSRHDVASVTKSVTSTLVGITLRKGLIRGLDDPLLKYFPERRPANLDDLKKSITLRDLLTMRSGLQCVAQPAEQTLMQMIGSKDWIQFMLDLPMAGKPGDVFVYNSGGVHLLSAIIRKASGKSALDFARAELFGPLGIADVSWPFDPQGIDNHGWGDLQLRPRDMAKIGYLFLNKGSWEGRSIVAPEWVEAATRPFPGGSQNDYGFLWWLSGDDGYSARGRGGQTIFVVPRLNMVVVMTGGGSRTAERLLKDYLLPAVVSPEASLPTASEAEALLRARIEEAARAPLPEAGAAPPWPEIVSQINGRWITLEANPFDLSRMKFDFGSPGEAAFFLRAPGLGDKDVAFPLGFNGIPRLSEGRNGLVMAGKGAWISPDTIQFEIDEIANINNYIFRLTFKESGVSGFVQERTGLGRANLRGSFLPQK